MIDVILRWLGVRKTPTPELPEHRRDCGVGMTVEESVADFYRQTAAARERCECEECMRIRLERLP